MALGFAGALLGQGLRHCAVHRAQQAGSQAFEVGAEAGQGRIQTIDQALVRAGLVLQGMRPGRAQFTGRGAQLLADFAELPRRHGYGLLLHDSGFARNLGHRLRQHWLETIARRPGAGAQAVVQRLGHGFGQTAVGLGDLLVKLRLVAD